METKINFGDMLTKFGHLYVQDDNGHVHNFGAFFEDSIEEEKLLEEYTEKEVTEEEIMEDANIFHEEFEDEPEDGKEDEPEKIEYKLKYVFVDKNGEPLKLYQRITPD